MTEIAIRRSAAAAILLAASFGLLGCEAPFNHITVVEVPSGTVAGVATENGILVLHKPAIKPDDIYPIMHAFGNGIVFDEAKVDDMDEYLALLTPLSSQLNTCRFLRFPMEPEEELYVGILDRENKARYLTAMLYKKGALGDFVICPELREYPEPSEEGYGGIGLFAYREGALWLAGVLTAMTAEIPGESEPVYPFVGLESIWRFLPELKNNFLREKKPTRPDFIYGVERDGSGE